MRTLAIDYGTRRIGLALSDAGGKFATPHDVLTISTPSHAIDQIIQIIQSEDVQQIVVGLPLNMDDTQGPMAKQTIDFAKTLSSKSGKKIIYVDERLSSFQAEQDISSRRRGGEKITHKSKKERLDALAAARFLQDFLDGKLPEIQI